VPGLARLQMSDIMTRVSAKVHTEPVEDPVAGDGDPVERILQFTIGSIIIGTEMKETKSYTFDRKTVVMLRYLKYQHTN